MADPLTESVERVQQMILREQPDARFKLEPGGHEGIYHLSVYAPEGGARLSLEVTEYLNQVWRDHKLTLITTVYSMAHYQENPEPTE